MSVQAYSGKKFIGDAATNHGWYRFCEHVLGRLDHERFANLRHLCEYGWTERITETQSELQRMLDESLYLDQPMKEITENLLSMVRRMRRHSTLIISDGLGD